MNRLLSTCLVLLLSMAADRSRADTFGSGANSFEIEFVTIDHPGNAPDDDPNPAGAVPYDYRIGKYEVSERMIDVANTLGGLGITKDTRGPDKPATSVTWYEAAQFVNWLNTSTGSVPAYKFDDTGTFQLWEPSDTGYDPNNLYRNSLAKYFLPSVDEWHKAAYYDPLAGHYWDYPTGSDNVPDGIDSVGDPDFDAVFGQPAVNPFPNDAKDIMSAGLPSPFGTVAQGGNVREWQETAWDQINDSPGEQRRTPGGGFGDISNVLAAWNTLSGAGPAGENYVIGIRVASVVPEPSSVVLGSVGLMLIVIGTRRSSNAR